MISACNTRQESGGDASAGSAALVYTRQRYEHITFQNSDESVDGRNPAPLGGYVGDPPAAPSFNIGREDGAMGRRIQWTEILHHQTETPHSILRQGYGVQRTDNIVGGPPFFSGWCRISSINRIPRMCLGVVSPHIRCLRNVNIK